LQKLLFGISGLPRGTGQKFNYASGIAYLKHFGLDAMELPFVRSVNVTANNKDAILRCKQENDFYLSAHASYYINLNADSPDKQNDSLARICKGPRRSPRRGLKPLDPKQASLYESGFERQYSP
jgi:deoxyribonuclease IV